jgi:hypothetical protein
VSLTSVATRLFLRMLCAKPPASDENFDVCPSAIVLRGCTIYCDLAALCTWISKRERQRENSPRGEEHWPQA